MSKTWWETPRTTQGHGIYSQYKPDHLKEWIHKEDRRLGQTTTSTDQLPSADTFYRSSLHAPVSDVPIEQRHHALTKSLAELRTYQQPPASPSRSHDLQYPSTPSAAVSQQPLEGTKFLPHLCHHQHFGWNPPTPQSRVAVVDSRINFYKMGTAQKDNQHIWSKASLISGRKA